MNSLDFILYSGKKASIMDCLHEIDIGEIKWNSLFKYLIDNTDTGYFYGFRVTEVNGELTKIVDLIAEEVFINKDYNRLLFRVKTANLILNRSLLNRLWLYYESAALIFLMDRNDERIFLEESRKNIFIKDFFNLLEGYFFLYQGVEDNVLWVESDQDFTDGFKDL